jgi:hypothetical protein
MEIVSSNSNNNNNISSKTAIDLKKCIITANEYFENKNLDVRGITWFEHLNIQVSSKHITDIFYGDVLGMTPDPSPSFHYNIGKQQFHFMLDEAHFVEGSVVQGSIGLSVPSLKDVINACQDVGLKKLSNTKFKIVNYDYSSKSDSKMLTLIGPYGNTFHIYQTGFDNNDSINSSNKLDTDKQKNKTFMEKKHLVWDKSMAVQGRAGIKFIEFYVLDVEAVASFYKCFFGCNIYFDNNGNVNKNSNSAVVQVGPNVNFIFTKNPNLTEKMMKKQKGIHVAVYVSKFKDSYDLLKKAQLIWTNPKFARLDTCDTWKDAKAGRQYRFKDLIDMQTKEKIFEMEHETRSMRHFQYLKDVHYIPFINAALEYHY